MISSTYIRTLIAQGEMEQANQLLGHPHSLTDTVSHGKKLGSKLGFPTVNLRIPTGVIVPAFGVYATRVFLEDGRAFSAVTNIGIRPTVADSDGRITVEGFILDFDGDLYGQTIRMEFFQFLRPGAEVSLAGRSAGCGEGERPSDQGLLLPPPLRLHLSHRRAGPLSGGRPFCLSVFFIIPLWLRQGCLSAYGPAPHRLPPEPQPSSSQTGAGWPPLP